ncbi:uncharacterized protein H6S33_009438 [Morchella sextelata]|uniref:uncharacterized protein n=1 Tax=Morchella sextelata TaxID=1174677 RepID=UPI001D053900|nr:uncharacterized protein H6S33_009438 [Morchella sextelata]KAH0613058.1 hypothetical protein H6S33_009438 [Morchella sextelata]
MSTTTTPIMSAKSNKTAKLPAKPHAKRTPAAKPPAKRTRATKASKTAESSKTAELSAKSSETVKPTEIAELVPKPSDSGTPAATVKPTAKHPAKRTRAAKASKSAESFQTAELPAEPAAKQVDTAEPAAEPSASGTPAAKQADTAEPAAEPSASGTPAAKQADTAEPAAEPSASGTPAAKPSDTTEPITKPSDSGTPAAKISESGRLGTKPSETRPIQYHESAAEALVMGGVTNTATAKKLASIDWIRPVMVKEDRGLNMARPVNVEAILGYSRGELAEAVCDCCTDSKGPFIECVTVQGMFAGSCTNCHYNSQGKYCNFRPEIKPRERSAPIASSSTVTAEGADRYRRVAKRKRSTTKEKWLRLLIAVEGVADAIEDIMDEMED